MRLFWPALLACGCRFAYDSAADDTAGGGVGVLRLGPPAPAVGIYDLVAHPDGSVVFVSNLHVPFITVVDAATGAWKDALDLRDQGQQRAVFQRLLVAEGALLATDQDREGLLRWDLDDLAPIEPIALGDTFAAGRTWQDDLWLATPTEVRRYAGTEVSASFPVPVIAQALAVDAERVAVLSQSPAEVHVFEWSGEELWHVRLAETWLNDALLVDGQVWVTDRATGCVIALADGAEIGRVALGSDAFALADAGDAVLATLRQGAALPPSGAYEGAPGVVAALDRDLSVRWQVETDKTIHFLASDGTRWWTAAEDALRLVAVDAAAGTLALRGPRVGLTLDHLALAGDRVLAPSHLTDELWWATFAETAAGAVQTCGWPLVTASGDDALWLLCQESGEVWGLDPGDLAPIEPLALASTFHPACDEGLCTGHDVLADLTLDGGVPAVSDPHLPGVRWADGREPVEVTRPAEGENALQHMGLRALRDDLLVYEPRGGVLWRVAGGALGGSAEAPVGDVGFPLAAGAGRVWAGNRAFDGDLSVLGTLAEEVSVVLESDAWIVAEQAHDLVVFDAVDLTERARLSLSELRAPPWIHDEAGERHDPLRYLAPHPDELVVANTFRGTLERRALPSLEPLGDGEVVPVGAWEDLPGLR